MTESSQVSRSDEAFLALKWKNGKMFSSRFLAVTVLPPVYSTDTVETVSWMDKAVLAEGIRSGSLFN